MNALFAFSQAELLRYLLILARVSPLMITAPIWGSPLVPGQVRVFLAMLVAALLLLVVRGPLPAGLDASALDLALAVGLELLVGYCIALFTTLLFAAAQFAGQVADIQVGFGIANVIDPLTSAQVTIIGQLQYLAALFIFLLLDGHHLLLRGLAETFTAAPLGHPLAGGHALQMVVEHGGRLLFSLGLSIAAPVITALFLVNLAMGLVSRMLPQMNVFMVGLPLNIGVGLVALAASLTLFTAVWEGAVGGLGAALAALARALGT